MPSARVNGIDIDYRIDGRGDPLVLIMGFGGPKEAWFFQRRPFGKRFQVVTFDNRGVGRSGKPPGPYTMQMMADDAVGLMDHLGIQKAHVAGVSMGGMIAQHVALSHPERVKKLVLGCTFASKDEEGGHSRAYVKALGLPEDATEDDLRAIDFRKVAAMVVYLAVNGWLASTVVRSLSRVFGAMLGTDGVRGQFEAILGHDTLASLHAVKAPTLVITGAEDRLIDPRSSDAIASRIPDARLVKVEGGSHMFFISRRGTFNREVLDFLQRS